MNHLDEILSHLHDILLKLGAEATKNILVVIRDVSEPDVRIERRIVIGDQYDSANLEIRVKRRHSLRPTRFRLQALTSDLSAETGFSGFVSQGRLTEAGAVEMLGRANRYNMPSWDAEFVLKE